MLATLLKSKITIPPMDSRMLLRRRLFLILERALTRKICVITAPAGYGKTTLISTWLSQMTMSVAWVTVEPNDASLSQFWCYIAAALEQSYPEIHQETQDIFHSYHGVSPEQAVSLFINMIQGGPDDHILVIDDFHHVAENSEICQSFAFFLDHLPEHIHVVLLSRSYPQFPLSRYRIEEQLVEIEMDKMKFHVDETIELFERIYGRTLSYKEASLIENSTEGWAAALKVIALSMPQAEHFEAFLQTFSGNHRFVLDYFVDEVIAKQPSEVQVFLLQTSILDNFNTSLCLAVTQIPHSSDIITYLETENIFIARNDMDRIWYRYHSLFAQVLQSRLLAHPDFLNEVHILHRRALNWYMEHGYTEQALQHALKIKDYTLVIHVISEHLEEFIAHGQENMVLSWLDSIPYEFFIRSFELRAFYVAMLYMTGRTQDLTKVLMNSQLLLRNENGSISMKERRGLEYQIIAMRATEALMKYQLDTFQSHIIELSSYTDIEKPRTDFVSENEVYLHRGSAAFHGRLSKSLKANVLTDSDPRSKHYDMERLEGRNKLLLAEIYYEMNALQDAKEQLEEIKAILDTSTNAGIVAPGLILTTKILWAEGCHQEACQQLRNYQHTLKARHIRRGEMLLEAFWVKLELMNGNFDLANHWVDRNHLHTEDRPTALREFEYLIFARILFYKGRIEESLNLLQRMLETAERTDRYGSRIEILLLISLCWRRLRNTRNMLTALTEAFDLAQSEGYLRIFIDEGEEVAQLCKSWLVSRENVDRSNIKVFAETLLKQFKIKPKASSNTWAISKLSLSNRQVEVLTLIDQGLSNEEIAAELNLSLGTVKRYVYDLFIKMEVKNRVQASIRGREQGLL